MFRFLLILMVVCLAAVACSPATSGVAGAPTPAVEDVHDDDAEPAAEHDEEHEADHDEDADHADHDEGEMDHDEEGEEPREHGAHEHGAAVLTVAWSGSDLEVDLDTPAFNLFGFEYEPSSDEDIQIVEEAVAALESGDLLGFNAEAGCQLIGATVATAWDHEGEHAKDANHDAGHEDANHDKEEGEVHSDVEAHFILECSSPDDIRSLDLAPLFERFPSLESLEAQGVSDTAQSSTELSAESSLLSLEP